VASRQNADIADARKLREVIMATVVRLPSGYNWLCKLAICCLILGVGFRGQAIR